MSSSLGLGDPDGTFLKFGEGNLSVSEAQDWCRYIGMELFSPEIMEDANDLVQLGLECETHAQICFLKNGFKNELVT